MELASPESIRALISDFENSQPRQHCRGARKSPDRSHKNGPCQCGRCAECRENARWERIFAEKFADPDYYTRCVAPITSPLASF